MEVVNKYTLYTLTNPADNSLCQAVSCCDAPLAVRHIRFFGQVYDAQTLVLLEDLGQDRAFEFSIGQKTLDCLPLYHALHHVKWTLYKLCQAKVDEVRVTVDTADHEVLDGCLQNTEWMQQLFQQLVDLMEAIDKWKDNCI